MPVLKFPGGRLAAFAAIIGLAACGRGSAAYNHIKDLPYYEWNSYASTLSVEQRLNLHKEIMERASHNPNMRIEESFEAIPDETFDAIVKRLKHGDNSRYYSGVIYAITDSDKFQFCSKPDRKIIQKYLWDITGYPDDGINHPSFFTC